MTNARRSKEKHRMEAREQFEQERRQSMQTANQVYECSRGLDHSHKCEGNCGIYHLTELEIELNAERNRWHELGMIPIGKPSHIPMPGIGVDSFRTEISFMVLMDLLEEAGLLKKEDLDIRFREKYLEILTDIREANEEEAKKQRSSVVDPVSLLEVPEYLKRKGTLN